MRCLLAIVIAYLLGCSNMAFYMEKIKHQSLRDRGSCNLGASNTVMLMGWKAGILVALHDIGKGILTVYLAGWLLPGMAYVPVIAGTACVLGHIFPFYLKFKGGKGFAPFVGVVFALDWRISLVIVMMIFAVTLITDYIVAGTMVTTISAPIALGLHSGNWWGALILSVASLTILIRHRDNLERIFMKGTEIGFRNGAKGNYRDP